MSRNGTGTYTLPAGNPVVTGTTISSTWANTSLSDIATALTQSLAKDGQTVPTANIPLGGFKITGLGAPTTAGDALAYGSSLGAVTATTGTFSGNVQMASANGGQLAGLRNKIINGNMGIFQRGAAAVTTSGSYGPADRWATTAIGDTFSATQGSFVSGDTLYDTGGAQFFTTIAVTSVLANTNACIFRQLIEDVRLLAGQTVTVSFWAKVASGTPSIAVSVDQFFGAGGSPSAQANGTGQAQALTTTWAQYTKTFAVPSINGKTIGTTANTSCTLLNFWLDAGSDFSGTPNRAASIGQSSKTVSIAQVQLEVGPVATPFEQRPIGMELALCQRYYYRIVAGTTLGVLANGFVQTNATYKGIGNFPVPLRTVPLALETTGVIADYGWNGTVAVVNTVLPAFNSRTNQYMWQVDNTTPASLVPGHGGSMSLGSTANAATFLAWSAEL